MLLLSYFSDLTLPVVFHIYGKGQSQNKQLISARVESKLENEGNSSDISLNGKIQKLGMLGLNSVRKKPAR